MSSVLTAKLGSLSKEHGTKPETKKEEKEEPPPEPSENDDKFGQMVQRCVIVQKDEKGYGLTVSGDNPVFVQSVKEMGAAARAGVQQGDKIIKVNGTLVTSSNHIEVVKLIKSGSYVALTLLGRPPGTPPKIPGGGAGGLPTDPASPTSPSLQHSPTSPIERPTGSDRISGPHKVDEKQDKEFQTQKISTIRMMYEKVAEEYQKLKEEITRNPVASAILMEKLAERGKLLQSLDQQLFQLTGIHAESHSGGLRSPPPVYMPPTPGYPPPAPVPIRRFGSGDHINANNNTSQDGTTSPTEGDIVYSQSSQSRSANPTPWLPHGPRHAKTNSMPETFYELDEAPSGKPREVTVSRSHSDSKKRERALSAYSQIKEGASEEEIEKLRDNIDMRRRKMMKTSSLPSGISQAGRVTAVPIDTSPNQHSPTGSPPTPHPVRDAWGEGMSDEDADPEKHANLSPSPESRPTLQVVAPSQVNVISMEDEEFSTDDEHLDDHGPFSDLNVLKHKPAHLAVFLHYLFSNSDPSPLFFYLVTETYTQGNMKEMRKWAYEIHSTFLVERAPLRVNVDEQIISSIDNILQFKHDKEDALRSVFQLARHIAQNEISEMLADFRNKRALGLGSLYGDHELHDDNMDRQAELRIVEKYLMPHFELLMNSSSDEVDKDRNQAMLSALATFFKQVGVPMSGKNSSTASLERCQSFVTRDRKMLQKVFNKQTKKVQIIRGGHTFRPCEYFMMTACNHCTANLWGVGQQGYQCSVCQYNVHKHCLDKVREQCRKKSERKRTSVLEKIIRNKPSDVANHPNAIKDAQRWHSTGDEPFTSPTQSSSLFNLRSAIRDDDDDELEKLRGTNRVHNLVSGYGDVSKSREDLRLPPTPPPHNHHRSPDNTDTDQDHNKKKQASLSRSESLNRKPEKSKNVRRTRSDVNADDTIKALGQAGGNYIAVTGYPNSSEESGFHSSETVSSTADTHHTHTHSHKTSVSWTQDDSDFEVESDLPPLDATIPKDVLKKLKPKEKKRQDVINEMFYTEKAHVRNLKVMQKLFYQAMLHEPWIHDDLVKLLFPNIDEMIKVHSKLNNSFKKTRKATEGSTINDVAQLLLNSFEGEEGENFKNACAIFCRNQTHSLDLLRVKTRKDQKFHMFLQDISGNPLCRRLELKDLIPTAMQRLTKYPLLLESLMKHTQTSSEEYELLQRAHACSKEILNYVNQAVRDCENHQKLVDFQRRLDKRSIENSTHPVILEYKNLDMTRHKMLYDGALTWRISRTKQIDLHVVLLEDILVLLQKQDDKLLLKCQSTTVVSGREDTKFTHSPIIKLSNLLTRNVATDRRAFFLVSTSDVGPQIYELVAPSLEGKKKWFKHITEAAESYKGKDKPANRRSVHKAGSSSSVNESAGEGAPQDETTHPREEDEDEERLRKDSKEERMSGLLERHASSSVDSVENLEQAEVLHINQSADLIQPSEVCVSDTMVMVEQPVRTNQELLVEKDELITRSIEEKQNLVAQILNVPIQDFQHVAEMATEDEGEKGARELLLAAIYQATQLTSLLNASLNLQTATSSSTVTMHSSHSNGEQAQQPVVKEPPAEVSESAEERLQGESAAGSDVTSPRASGSEALTVTLPCQPVNNVASRLHQHLNQLLDVINRREEETERLQEQLKLTTEQLSRLQDSSPLNHSTSQPTSRPDSFVSSASEPGEPDTSTGQDEALTIPVQSTDENSLLNTSTDSPKLTPIVVSHVVTSEVSVDKLASLTISDPSENVMTSSPAIVTSLDEEETDTALTSPQDDDVKNTEEMAELV